VPDENPSSLGTFDMPLRFLGQYGDKETGLAYNMARDDDAGVGRYVQSDPIGLDGGLNTYAYVLGNPLSYVDPKDSLEASLAGHTILLFSPKCAARDLILAQLYEARCGD
jgi:RHS repeat-associated protein